MQQDEHRLRGSTNVREDKCVYSENYYIETLQLNCMCMETYQCDTHVRGDAHVSGDVCLKHTRCASHLGKHTCVWRQKCWDTRVRGDTPHMCGNTTVYRNNTLMCMEALMRGETQSWTIICVGRGHGIYVWETQTDLYDHQLHCHVYYDFVCAQTDSTNTHDCKTPCCPPGSGPKMIIICDCIINGITT